MKADEYPEIIYHYTSLEALWNILNGSVKDEQENIHVNIRATHMDYMNDPTEYKYFINNLCDCVDRYNKEVLSIEKEPWLRNFELGNLRNKEYYIFSLSECRDKLLMWRGYGNNGQGIAIGFNLAKLMELKSLILTKCTYGTEEEIMRYTSSKIDRINDAYKQDGIVVNLDAGVMQDIEYWKVRYKHPAYREEEEWRLVYDADSYSVHSDNVVRYRAKQDLIVPYVNLKIPTSCISEIIIGPSAEQTLTQHSLFKFASEKIQAQIFRMPISEVPYIVR